MQLIALLIALIIKFILAELKMVIQHIENWQTVFLLGVLEHSPCDIVMDLQL